MKSPNRVNPFLLLPLAILTLISFQGCGIFDEGEPDTARVVITGPAEDFQLVTTNDFDVLGGGAEEVNTVYLNSADTATVTAPYNQRFSLGSRKRFYLMAFSAEGLSQPVNVKVFVGDEERSNSTSTLEDLSLEFIFTVR
jgi:hypothetical protein